MRPGMIPSPVQSTVPTIDLMDANMSRTSAARFDPLTESPCKRRPDTGEPCPLLWRNKKNPLCHKCGLMDGKPGPSLDEIQLAIFQNIVDKPEQDPTFRATKGTYAWDKPKRGKLCAFPGCDKPPKGIEVVFCNRHQSLVHNRLQHWYRDNVGKPPLDWLMRPVWARSDNG